MPKLYKVTNVLSVLLSEPTIDWLKTYSKADVDDR